MNNLQKYDGELIERRPIPFEEPPKAESVGMADMLKGILRRWYIAVLTFLAISVIGIPLVWLAIKPLYDVTGAIRVAPILRNIVTGETDAGEITNYESFMNTQAELITSDRVVQRVADDLADKKLNFWQEVSNRFVEKIKSKIDNTPIQQEPVTLLKRAITDGIIVVAPGRRTELIKITVKCRNPKEAEQIVNSFINNYTAVQSSNEMQGGALQVEQLRKYQKELDEKIKGERQQLRSVQEYVTTASGSQKDATLQDQITILTTELTKAEAAIIRLETKIKFSDKIIAEENSRVDVNAKPAEDVNRSDELLIMRANHINSDPTVQSLTKTRDQMELELMVLRKTLVPGNPELKQKEELFETYKSRLDEQRHQVGEEFDRTFAKVPQKTVKQNLPKVSNDPLLADRTELEAMKEFEKH